jgi:hypothetical protein
MVPDPAKSPRPLPTTPNYTGYNPRSSVRPTRLQPALDHANISRNTAGEPFYTSLSAIEQPPSVFHIYTFIPSASAGAAGNGSSPGEAGRDSEGAPAATGADHAGVAGGADNEPAVRHRCFSGWGARQPPPQSPVPPRQAGNNRGGVGGPSPTAVSADERMSAGTGEAGAGAELAIHRAARRGNAGVLRLVLRCRRRRRRSMRA